MARRRRGLSRHGSEHRVPRPWARAGRPSLCSCSTSGEHAGCRQPGEEARLPHGRSVTAHPGKPPRRPQGHFAPWCPPRGSINHGSVIGSMCTFVLCSTLFSYGNNPGIDRIILMRFNLTLPIDNVFVKIILNNHKWIRRGHRSPAHGYPDTPAANARDPRSGMPEFPPAAACPPGFGLWVPTRLAGVRSDLESLGESVGE